MPPMQILKYRNTSNLGDAVQSIALSRLLPGPLRGIWRDRCEEADPHIPFVVNGWIGRNRPPVENRNCLFAGVFIFENEANFQWMRASRYSRGARDPYTVLTCGDRGLRARLLGCATLTFERYEGPRAGVFAVDVKRTAVPPEARRLTHSQEGSWSFQWARALEYLDLYRRAELVITSRLHVALPCLAFGTPVIIEDPLARGSDWEALRRLSLLDAMHVRYGIPTTLDVSPWSERYCSFLSEQLKMPVVPGAPQFPA